MAIEQMDTFPELARFAIRDMGKTVAAGVCMKIEKKQIIQRVCGVVRMANVTVIKLTGENHVDVDSVCDSIRTICETTGLKLRGPIPLPTRKLVVPCRKSPDGEGSETWDRWEMRIHKRLLEINVTTSKDETALRNIAKIPIPDSVSIEWWMRTVN